MHRATLAAVVAARYFTFRSSLFLYLVQISSRRSSQSVFCAPYFIVVCNTLEVGGVKHNKVHIGLLTLFSSESNLPAFFSIRLVSSRFLADQHSWLPTPAVAARPRAPRNLLGFRRDRVHSLDNRPCHNAPGLLRRGSAILHMLGGLTLGEAQQNLMQICSVGVPARASEGPHHQSS